AQHGPVHLVFSLFQGGEPWGLAQVQQWNRLNGLTVTLNSVSATVAGQNLITGNWQMAVKGASGSDPEGYYAQWDSTQKGNVWHYNNPTVDAALTQLRSETNPKKQFDLWTTATQQWLNDAPMVFWYRNVLPILIRKGISGVQRANRLFPNFADLW